MHLSLLGKAFLVAVGAYAVSKVVQPTTHVVQVLPPPTPPTPTPNPFLERLQLLAGAGDLFGFIQAFDSHGHGEVSMSKRVEAYDDWRTHIARST